MDPLATSAEFATATGIDLDTARADDLLAQASDVIRLYCGWHIAPLVEADEVTIDGSGAVVQTLPTLRLTDVSAVTEHGESVDIDSIEWSADGFLYRSCPWTTRLRGITATIDHGYPTTPKAIHAVLFAIVGRASASPTGTVREQAGPYGATYTQTAPGQAGGMVALQSEKWILDRYAIPVRP